MTASNPITGFFGEVISKYSLQQAIEDALLEKVGEEEIKARLKEC